MQSRSFQTDLRPCSPLPKITPPFAGCKSWKAPPELGMRSEGSGGARALRCHKMYRVVLGGKGAKATNAKPASPPQHIQAPLIPQFPPQHHLLDKTAPTSITSIHSLPPDEVCFPGQKYTTKATAYTLGKCRTPGKRCAGDR